ncbi:MAG: hypothetical protein US69_C0015G0010 [candidate division TM6 bacterium GW2011_GWF2_38_10]|nr:MAG: hypothetical protein US69_C0015G0010 [candidate division TM6 bacterium GW2011_GWF2_38_10]
MKTSPFALFFIFVCFCAGTLFFLVQQKWIIVEWTYNQQSLETAPFQKDVVLKKEIQFYWWNNNRMHHEKMPLVWRHNKNDENITQVIHTWLDYMKTEKIIDATVTIQSTLLSPFEEEAYISFNKKFAWQEWSIFDKHMLIESLCKTIKSTGLPIKHITFLINHEPFIDDHLDFSAAWPTDGFIQV